MSYRGTSDMMSRNPNPGPNNVDDLSNTMSNCNIGSGFTTNNLSFGGLNASRMIRSRPSIGMQSTKFRQNSQDLKASSSTGVPNGASLRRFEFVYSNEYKSKNSRSILLKKSDKSLNKKLNKCFPSRNKSLSPANKSSQPVSFGESSKGFGTTNKVYDNWQNKPLVNASSLKQSVIKPKGNKSSNKNISMKYNLNDYKTKSSNHDLKRGSTKNSNMSRSTHPNKSSR